jgi:hypothetical protein
MARPLRRLYPVPGFQRRRHRSWIASMTCATLSLVVIGIDHAWEHWSHGPGVATAWLAVIVTTISLPGLYFGFMTLRGKLAWIAYAAVPLAANALVLALPWVETHAS